MIFFYVLPPQKAAQHGEEQSLAALLTQLSDVFFPTDYTDGHRCFLTQVVRIAQIVGALMAPAMRDVLLISHRRLRRQ